MKITWKTSSSYSIKKRETIYLTRELKTLTNGFAWEKQQEMCTGIFLLICFKLYIIPRTLNRIWNLKKKSKWIFHYAVQVRQSSALSLYRRNKEEPWFLSAEQNWEVLSNDAFYWIKEQELQSRVCPESERWFCRLRTYLLLSEGPHLKTYSIGVGEMA